MMIIIIMLLGTNHMPTQIVDPKQVPEIEEPLPNQDLEAIEDGEFESLPDHPDLSAKPKSLGRSRPRPPEAAVGDYVPKPPHFKFSTDRPAGQRPNDFFRWWSKLPPKCQSLLVAYVYRHWPVIRIVTKDRKGNPKPSMQIAKVPGGQPITDLDQMLHQWGGGDYMIRLNTDHTIAHCTITGLRDNDHPPVIPDLSCLVMDDPANRSYVEMLRMRGVKLPGSEQEDEQDMAQVAALETMGRAVESLSDKLIEQAEQSVERASKAQPAPPPDTGAQAQLKGMEVVTEAAKISNQMIQGAANSAREMQAKTGDPMATLDKAADLINKLRGSEKAVTPSTAVDPMDTLNKAADLLTKLRGPDKPVAEDTTVKLLMQQLMDRQNELQKQLFQVQNERILFAEKLAADKAAIPIPPAAAESSLAKMIREYKDLRDLINPEGEAEPAAKTGNKLVDLLPSLIQGGLLLASVIGNAIFNARTQGPPVPPPQPQPGLAPELAAAAVAAGAINPAPAPDPGAGSAPSEADRYTMMLRQMEGPLLTSLNEGQSGDEFADTLIRWAGRIPYDHLKGLGKDAILALLQTYQPIWLQVTQIPQRFNQFLDEFLDYDEIMAAQEADEAGQDQQPAQPEVLRKVKIQGIQDRGPGANQPA